jgi:glycosyltransferase involved in cell wall biosynthesis
MSCGCPKKLKEYINIRDIKERNRKFLTTFIDVILNLEKLDEIAYRLEVFELLKNHPEILNLFYFNPSIFKHYLKTISYKTKVFVINNNIDIKELIKWNTGLIYQV